MDFKHLNTFKVIVEEGSFSRAAERLHYTQSAITFQMRQLEQDLATCLFEKIGRKMTITKAGQQLLPYIDEIFKSVERLRLFEDDLSNYYGDLHIGVGESLLCYRLPIVLKKLNAQAPKARLFLRSMNCYDIRDELIEGRLDIGVFYDFVGGFGSSLMTKPLGTHPLTLVASPEVKKLYPDFITQDQSIPLPFIINEPTCVFRQIFEQYLRDNAIMLDHTIELWSIPTIKNLVKNNVGISFLPRFTVEEELAAGTLAEIPTTLKTSAIAATCGWHKNKWISPLMQLFIDLCVEAEED